MADRKKNIAGLFPVFVIGGWAIALAGMMLMSNCGLVKGLNNEGKKVESGITPKPQR